VGLLYYYIMNKKRRGRKTPPTKSIGEGTIRMGNNFYRVPDRLTFEKV